jgi:sugar phosphate isomerase/epimerase
MIGICFPESDFLTMDFDEFKEYIHSFKDKGLYSFDIFTSLLISNHKNINELLSFLNDNDIKITFHYAGNNLDVGSLDDMKAEMVLNQYRDDLIKLRNKLQACDIFYKTTIVFHALNYEEEYQKYEHELNQIKIFNELCEIAEKLDFDILIETLSYNHPSGNHLGDDYNEIEKIVGEVKHNNFGVCWDIGHTRLNALEEYTDIYLPSNIMEKVKFTHIHSYSPDDGKYEVEGHLPLINKTHIDKELHYLFNSNYQGIYSLEINTGHLKENINIYLDSINILSNMLEEEK